MYQLTQYSIFFNNLGSFNWKSEFQKPENLNEPYYQGCKNQYRWSVATQGFIGETTVLMLSWR